MLWVQVKGTASPTRVTCKEGDIDGLKKAAKAAMPSYLRTTASLLQCMMNLNTLVTT